MDDFDKRFNRMQKFIAVWVVACGVVTICGLGFVGWIIAKVLQHFAII